MYNITVKVYTSYQNLILNYAELDLIKIIRNLLQVKLILFSVAITSMKGSLGKSTVYNI